MGFRAIRLMKSKELTNFIVMKKLIINNGIWLTVL